MARISGLRLGNFGASGGFLVIYPRKNLTPKKAGFKIAQLGNYVEDVAAPMRAIKYIAQADVKQRFVTDTAPNGDSWVPLDPGYKRWKEGRGGPGNDVDTWSGKLEDAASSSKAFKIVGGMLTYEKDALPLSRHGVNYGLILDLGTGTPSESALGRRLAGGVAGKTTTVRAPKTGKGRGKGLPSRPFIGISHTAEIQIVAIIAAWAERGHKNMFVASSGLIHERTALGRIGAPLRPELPLSERLRALKR